MDCDAIIAKTIFAVVSVVAVGGALLASHGDFHTLQGVSKIVLGVGMVAVALIALKKFLRGD